VNLIKNFLLLAATEGSPLWRSKKPHEKEEYKRMIIKPMEETRNLIKFRPFLKWQRATDRLLTNHQIHVLAICAHEHEDGRIVEPLSVNNSGKSMEIKKRHTDFTCSMVVTASSFRCQCHFL
jgi:hypothetical protein